jgi:hypothetical protein
MKIILIEDRVIRKELFLERSAIDLSQYSFLREITAQELKQLKLDINNGDYMSFLGEFDLIITHKSAFTLNQQDVLASSGKSIIYFSGGISQSFYLEYPFPCLHINSSDFYSNNLMDFLNNIKDNGKIEMLILQFGTKWKLNLLLSTRDKIKQLLYKNFMMDLFPEDFNDILNDKLLTLISSNQLKSNILKIRESGLMWTDLKKMDIVFEELNEEIRNNIY